MARLVEFNNVQLIISTLFADLSLSSPNKLNLSISSEKERKEGCSSNWYSPKLEGVS
jgi:hypothetical protein